MDKRKKIGKLTKDWFDRRSEDSFMRKTGPRALLWDKGHDNELSSFFINDAETKVQDAAGIVSTMFSVLDVSKHRTKSLSKKHKGDYNRVSVPLGMLKEEGKWKDLDYHELDAFYGACIQNGAMYSLQSRKEWSSMIDNRKKSTYKKANKVKNLLSEVINTERVNEKISQKFPGYSKFVQKFKDYTYDENYKELPEDADKKTKFLDLVVRMLRYPSHVTEEELTEFAEPLSKIERYIKKYGGIPETLDECNSMAESLSKIVYKYIPVEEEPPPSPSGGPGKDDSEEPEDSDSDSTDSSGKEDSKSDSSDDDKGDSSEDSSEDSSTSAEAEGDESGSGEPSGSSTMSKEELDDIAKDMLDTLTESSTDMSEITDSDVKMFKEAMEESDSRKDEDSIYESSEGVKPSPIFFMKSSTDSTRYQNIRNNIDFTKAHVFHTMFERKAVEYDYAIKGMKTGRLDPNKIAEAIQGVPTVYEKIGNVTTNKILIGVLVDESGSMAGSKIIKAREAAIYIHEIFKKMHNVDLFIYGHTGDEGIKGRNETLIRVYKEKGLQEDPHALGSISARNQNRDGYAILATARRIRNFSNDHGIIFVMSDGQPTAGGYNGGAGIRDTAEKVRQAEALGFQVIQIAIEEDVPSEKMFTHFIKMTNINSFPKKFANYMATKVDKLIKTSHTVQG